MTFTPRRAEATVSYLGHIFTLVFDMETVARYEEATGRSFLQDVAELAANQTDNDDPEQPRKPVQLRRIGELLLAALGECHPELTRKHAMQMALDPKINTAFGNTLSGGMPRPSDIDPEGGAAASGNRQQRRAAKPARSGGKISISKGSKPASTRRRSGG
jgi:hypothetical protein